MKNIRFNVDGTKMNSVEWLAMQTMTASSVVAPIIRCCCFKLVPLRHAYKCLYCDEWFCITCAEIHFGKTVEQYKLER